MAESYETKLKQYSSGLKFEKDSVKDEPIDCQTQQRNLANHALEMQVMKDRLEQAQIDLGLNSFLFLFDFIEKKFVFFFFLYRKMSNRKCDIKSKITFT